MYAETAAVSSEDRIKIHCICSLICSCILVDLEEVNLSYITSVEGRVIFSRKEVNDKKNKENRKIELANLAMLEINKQPFHAASASSNSENRLF